MPTWRRKAMTSQWQFAYQHLSTPQRQPCFSSRGLTHPPTQAVPFCSHRVCLPRTLLLEAITQLKISQCHMKSNRNGFYLTPSHTSFRFPWKLTATSRYEYEYTNACSKLSSLVLSGGALPHGMQEVAIQLNSILSLLTTTAGHSYSHRCAFWPGPG